MSSSPRFPARLPLARFATFAGEVLMPGSKSIANRALLLAALAEGETELVNLPEADDISVLLRALPQLGVVLDPSIASAGELERRGDPVTVCGVGGPFAPPAARSGAAPLQLNLDNAGTALRPLTAILAASEGDFVIDGNEQMRRRPIGDLILGLQGLGADVRCEDEASGCPPVRVRGRGLPGGRTELSGRVSSQYLSAMLMVSPLARGDVEIVLRDEPVSKPYIDLTIAMLADFGVNVERGAGDEFYRSFRIAAGQRLRSPGLYPIEGDATAATYFLGAGSLPGCGPVRVRGLGRDSRQGDARFRELLERMGARISVGPDWTEARGPVDAQGRPTKLRALDEDMNAMPDAAMTLAVLALFCEGETRIRNIENLRVKESERIRGLRIELEKLGAQVEEGRDYLYILPPERLQPAEIETYRDHRMAMAFALAAAGTELSILDPGCVAKTYLRFFEDFLPMAGLSLEALLA